MAESTNLRLKLVKRVRNMLVMKAAVPVVLVLVVFFGMFWVISTAVSVATAPIVAAKEAIAGFFSPGSTDENTDVENLSAFSSCIGQSSLDLAGIATTVPPRADPETARGWVMYSLAHPHDVQSANGQAGGPDGAGAGAVSEQTFRSIVEFSQAWQATAAGGSERDDLPAVPLALELVDPSTAYDRYAAAGLATTLELALQGVVTVDEDQENALYSALAVQCLDEDG
ncbi:hypothetical protein EEB14_22950 [Rhodococcus sp. WS4]|nr:hypothetical protein EEB14_22950 [Rhodococcus sp. WS4]